MMLLGRFVWIIALFATSCRKTDAPATTVDRTPQHDSDRRATLGEQEPADHNASLSQPSPVPVPAADPWTAPTAAADPLPRPLFWSAAKDGKVTYLLGTMHMGVDARARLPKVVWDRLDAAPALAVETDATDPAVLGMGRRASGTLRDDLGPVYWKKLEQALEPNLVAAVDRMKPAIAVLMLSLRGLPPTPAMDSILLAHAKSNNKQIIFLEPASLQVTLLEKWLDIRALKIILDAPDKQLATTKAMLAAYISGDEGKLLAIAEGQKADQLAHGITEQEYQDSMTDLLYRRNASWIAAIEKLHARGNGFVAVGALHLVGPKSVADLLIKRGFTVTRIGP